MKQPEPSTAATAKAPETRCEECGRFGAMEVAGRCLCENCYCLHGSCCTEFTPERNPSQPVAEETATDGQ